MPTLFSELARHTERLTDQPRVYADANVPRGAVTFMRQQLGWDVLFVVEEDDLRRAPDVRHFYLSQQLQRTLVTMDRDYLDDRRYPPAETGGVLVLSTPDERRLLQVLRRIDRSIFRGQAEVARLPLARRKLHVHTDWRR